MENNNETQPIPQPPASEKWYQHKGIIAIVILAILAALAVWIYFAYQPTQTVSTIIVQHTTKQLQQPAPASTPTPNNQQILSPATTTQSSIATSSTTDINGWKTYTDYDYGYSFQYPGNWQDAGYNQYSTDIKDYFTAPPEVEVLDLDILNNSGSPRQVAQEDITSNNCPTGDGIIQSSNTDALYTLSCSAGTEDYVYIVQVEPSTYVKLSYHDNFDESWPQAQKLAVLNQIISTFKFNVSFDMSNWITYTNNGYGFSFNYPVATTADYQPTIGQRINAYNASSTDFSFDGAAFYIEVQANPGGSSLHDWFEKNVDENGILLQNQNFKPLTTNNGVDALWNPGDTFLPADYQGDGGIPTDLWYVETPDGKYIISYNYESQYDALSGYGIPNDDGYLLGKEILKSFKFTK